MGCREGKGSNTKREQLILTQVRFVAEPGHP